MLHRLFTAASGLATVLATGLALSAPPAVAQDQGGLMDNRRTLGIGHFFDNDFLGDNKDRWQTGSYTVSVIRGTGWDGSLPSRPFEIMEYRGGGSIIAPSRLKAPAAWDRRYVGRLTVSAHTQFAPRPGLESALGLGLVATGPDTGISGLHRTLHRLFSAPEPVAANAQLGNHIYPLAMAEFGRPFQLGGAELRPFVEGRAGDETLMRAGVDLRFGAREGGALWLRDEITGQRYVGISGPTPPGTSFVLGADVAHVFDSHYFPDAGVDFTPTRRRLRAGVDTRLGAVGLFYGVTYLSEEFKTQPEGQVTGSLRMRLNF